MQPIDDVVRDLGQPGVLASLIEALSEKTVRIPPLSPSFLCSHVCPSVGPHFKNTHPVSSAKDRTGTNKHCLSDENHDTPSTPSSVPHQVARTLDFMFKDCNVKMSLKPSAENLIAGDEKDVRSHSLCVVVALVVDSSPPSPPACVGACAGVGTHVEVYAV